MQIFGEGKACFSLLSTGNIYHRQGGIKKNAAKLRAKYCRSSLSAELALQLPASSSTGPAAVTNCTWSPEEQTQLLTLWGSRKSSRVGGRTPEIWSSSDILLFDHNEQFIPSPAISHFPLDLQFSPCYLNGLVSEGCNEMSTSHPLVEGPGPNQIISCIHQFELEKASCSLVPHSWAWRSYEIQQWWSKWQPIGQLFICRQLCTRRMTKTSKFYWVSTPHNSPINSLPLPSDL